MVFPVAKPMGETGKFHVADHALAQWRNLMLRLWFCDLTSLLAFTRQLLTISCNHN